MADWSQQLEDDLAWREGEIASLKLAIVAAQPGRRAPLLRAAWALLYAHYEGFCRYAWGLYLDTLTKSGHLRRDCKEGLAVLSLSAVFAELKGDMSPRALWEFCQTTFPDLLARQIAFPDRTEGTGNLWPRVFCSTCDAMHLPHAAADEHWSKLGSLVGRRNRIAHGYRLEAPDLHEYEDYAHVALLVMHELAIGIVDSLEKSLYLHSA